MIKELHGANLSLQGKRIVVTGGARGLGRAYAEACAAAGAEIIITDILQNEGLQTEADLVASGASVKFVAVDFGDPDSVVRMGQEIASRWDRIDGLVNNAALATGLGGKRMESIDVEVWDHVMAVNVRGVWLATKACLPGLKNSGSGKIVNISSDVALFGSDFILHYVASKGAVVSMSRAMARELGPEGISVNCIAPGMTKVEATAGVPSSRHQRYVDGRFLKREQHPDDLIGVVAFLLSDSASFITGQLIAVNGGYVLN